MITSALLSEERYIEAMKSAELKDPTTNYRLLKSKRSIALLYNPATRDAMFSTTLNAKIYLAAGYYEAFPHIGFAETLAENNANLAKYGWPDFKGI